MKRIYFLLIVSFISNCIHAQVKIGDNPTVINSNSLLELESTGKGLVLTRLTDAQMNGMINPLKGMIVFNTTDSSLYVRRALSWNIVASGYTALWSLNGNNIFNSNSGNIGIGTSSPAKPLDVAKAGGIQISNGENVSSNNELYFTDNGQIRSLDDFHRIVFNRSNDQLEFHELGKIIFKTGNPIAEAMRITNSGYVGIGTTLPSTPNNLLSVAGGITVDYNNQNIGTVANILSFGSGGGEGIGSYRPGISPVNYRGLDFYTNFTKRMSIDAGGNVGIGTTTPAAKLDVEGTVKFADGSQGDGKVLTSDANGNAYWKGVVACSVSKEQNFSTLNDTLPNGYRDIIFYHEFYDEGGNNYDPATGLFTAPVAGIYNCSANILLTRFSGNSSSVSGINLTLMVNGGFHGALNLYQCGDYVQVVFGIDVKLNAGDNMNIRLYNNTSDEYEIEQFRTSNMSVHLVK